MYMQEIIQRLELNFLVICQTKYKHLSTFTNHAYQVGEILIKTVVST